MFGIQQQIGIYALVRHMKSRLTCHVVCDNPWLDLKAVRFVDSYFGCSDATVSFVFHVVMPCCGRCLGNDQDVEAPLLDVCLLEACEKSLKVSACLPRSRILRGSWWPFRNSGDEVELRIAVLGGPDCDIFGPKKETAWCRWGGRVVHEVQGLLPDTRYTVQVSLLIEGQQSSEEALLQSLEARTAPASTCQFAGEDWGRSAFGKEGKDPKKDAQTSIRLLMFLFQSLVLFMSGCEVEARKVPLFASARVLCTEGLCHTSMKSAQLQTSRDHTAARFCSFAVRRFAVMAVGSPLLQPNAEWKVLSKCKQLWERCVLLLSEPKVVARGLGIMMLSVVICGMCLLHLVTPAGVDEEPVARNAADVRNETRVDMACLCGGTSTVRSVRAVEACCREAATTGDSVAHQACLGDVETCIGLHSPSSPDWSVSAMCLMTICPNVAPFCHLHWDEC
ncbi:unnamed protein product [Symbiodinium sp. CCMP2592]|nr:unnamed protein product [Symbiodinium sp. CCMP2592]